VRVCAQEYSADENQQKLTLKISFNKDKFDSCQLHVQFSLPIHNMALPAVKQNLALFETKI